MNTLSPRAQKAQREALGRHLAQATYHDQGPHLNTDGTYVIVPSVKYNPALASKLKANGFVFEPGEYPQWQRCAAYAAPDGKVYSAEQWLKSAQRLYAEVWDWEPIKEGA